jgi:AcrR family transcriptional regulator
MSEFSLIDCTTVSSPAPPVQSPDRPRRARAAALPAEDRRAAIVDAVVPLIIREGTGVTTRQIADAAGIAEGTIFRVFADKQAVVDAVVDAVIDPAREIEALAAIPRDLPLEARLAAAVALLQRRVDVIWQLMAAVDMTKSLAERRRAGRRNDAPEILALADLIAPDAGQLRIDAAKAGQMLRSLTWATSHPAFVDDPSSPADVVSILLDGIRAR